MSADVLVFEPTSHWTAELERAGGTGPQMLVHWKPYPADLLQECRAQPPRVIVLSVSPGDESLDLLRNVRESAPAARLVCLVEGDPAEWEWLARELGADVVLPDSVEKQRVVTAVGRLLAPPNLREQRIPGIDGTSPSAVAVIK